MPERTVLFVCTGNVCRSPMAELLLREHLGAGSGWSALSAGLSADSGSPASETAVSVMREVGIDLRSHLSRPVDKKLIRSASVIVAMTGFHRQQLQARYPEAREKIFLMASFLPGGGNGDVADPIGMPLAEYRRVRNLLSEALPGLIEFLHTLEL